MSSSDEYWRLQRLKTRTCANNPTRFENCSRGGKAFLRYGPTLHRKISSLGGLVVLYSYGPKHFQLLQRAGVYKRRFNKEVRLAIQASAQKQEQTGA